MVREYGDDFNRALIDTSTGKVSSSVVMALNGVDVEVVEGLKTVPKDGDIVDIFPWIVGGSKVPSAASQ